MVVQCKQGKYSDKNFDEMLQTSHSFVEDICRIASKNDFIVRQKDDLNPFICPDGTRIRLWDIMLIDNVPPHKSFQIEAKDWASLLKWEATGLPQKYIDNKMMLAKQGEDLIILFRQNMDWVNAYSKYHKISVARILNHLESIGLAQQLANKEWYFFPYGNFLNTLMKKEHRRLDLEGKVLSRLNSYRGQKQYIWTLKAMINLPMLIRWVIRNRNVPHLGI